MSLGQNDRSRGRQTNRGREPNPLTRSYDSHGPDVRIRGSALHVAERYLQLARDTRAATLSPRRTIFVHAEHYFRIDRRSAGRAIPGPERRRAGYRRSRSGRLGR